MRILMATDAWEPQVNGVVRTLARTAAECRAMGHEVLIVEPGQFRTVPLPTYAEIRLAVGCYVGIQEQLKAFEPEAIHIATEGPIGLATRRICIEWKLPFTTSYHTRFPEYISARLPVPVGAGYAYMKWFHKPSGRVMVATATMREELERHGFHNISQWTRGVDTVLFHPGRAPVFQDLKRPVWLNVGRIAVEKNLEAFLALDLPGTKVVVGEGPQRHELETKYPETRFLGPKFGEDLADAYADADVFVFPSLTDTFGLVILEAMASGTPVAGFNAPGPADLIPGSEAGVLAADEHGLKAACMEALKIPPAQARAYAERFSWRACAEEFVRNLEPQPEPEKRRFWKRLRRIARLRRKSPVAL